MELNGVTPAVYVGTYKKYNEGSLYGKWMQLEDYSSFDEFCDACRELHKDEDEPEFMCQDYEGIPRNLYCEAGLDWIEKVYDLMDMDEDDANKVLEYWDEVYDGIDANKVLDRYFCEAMSDEDFGYYYAHELGGLEIPASCEPYFDYDRFGHDFLFDFYKTENYIFSQC